MNAALGTKGLERGYEGRARLEREGSRGTIRAFSPTSLFPLAVRVLTRQPRAQRKGKRQFAVVFFSPNLDYANLFNCIIILSPNGPAAEIQFTVTCSCSPLGLFTLLSWGKELTQHGTPQYMCRLTFSFLRSRCCRCRGCLQSFARVEQRLHCSLTFFNATRFTA